MIIRPSIAGATLGALAAAAAVLVAGAPASAGVVSYTLSGRLDGAIGGTALSDTPFTWTVKADNLAPVQAAGLPALQGLSSDIRLGGVGDAGFAQPVYVVDNASNEIFAFTDQAVANGAGWVSPAFASLPLGAAFASQPVTLSGAVGSLQTSLGAFQLADATDLTFTATIAPSPPVLYTLKGDLSGTLGGVAFTDDPFSWTVTADTTNLAAYNGFPALTALGGAIDLGGFGRLVPTGSFEVALNSSNDAFGVLTPDGTQGVAVLAPAFGGYALGGTLANLPVDFWASLPVDTSGGALDISGATNLTLSAGAVPEPSTWLLAILGLSLVGAGLRSQRRRAFAVAA
jgi:hypothetical protein